MIRFTLCGMYWYHTLTPDKLSAAHKYMGTMEVQPDGALAGEVVDEFGWAKITGRKSGQDMRWQKVYDPTRSNNGAKFPISYTFVNYGDGWIGTYSNDIEEHADPNLIGRTSCVLFHN